MARPVIALLTDFGTRDHYVGTMKGVMLGICPDAALVDITHDIPPQDVLAAALELGAAARYFPAGTVFLVVVDPGVGSSRRAIAAEAGGHRFVAPDNGVLTTVLGGEGECAAVELIERRFQMPSLSRTFEGRDRFAPAAAWLASGTPLSALGPAAADLRRLSIPEPAAAGDRLEGVVLRVDRFGNLITNISRAAFAAWTASAAVRIAAAGQPVPVLVETYAEAPPGGVCALFGSTDYLEIAVNGGRADERLAAGRGARVEVRRGG